MSLVLVGLVCANMKPEVRGSEIWEKLCVQLELAINDLSETPPNKGKLVTGQQWLDFWQ